jgi:hypothetical protein
MPLFAQGERTKEKEVSRFIERAKRGYDQRTRSIKS